MTIISTTNSSQRTSSASSSPSTPTTITTTTSNKRTTAGTAATAVTTAVTKPPPQSTNPQNAHPSSTSHESQDEANKEVTKMKMKKRKDSLVYIRYDPAYENDYVASMRQLISKDLSEPYSIYVYRYFLYQWGDLCFMAFDNDHDLTYSNDDNDNGSDDDEAASTNNGDGDGEFDPNVGAENEVSAGRGKGGGRGGGQAGEGDHDQQTQQKPQEQIQKQRQKQKRARELVGVVVSKLESHRGGPLRGYIAMLAVREEYRGRGIATKLVQMAIDAMIKRDADEIALETEVTNTAAIKLYQRLGFLRSKRLHRYYLNGNSAFRLVLYLKEGVASIPTGYDPSAPPPAPLAPLAPPHFFVVEGDGEGGEEGRGGVGGDLRSETERPLLDANYSSSAALEPT